MRKAKILAISDLVEKASDRPKSGVPEPEVQAKKIYDALVAADALEAQHFQGTGIVPPRTRLSVAYSRPLKELQARQKIYHITKTNSDLLQWFKSRSRVKFVSDP